MGCQINEVTGGKKWVDMLKGHRLGCIASGEDCVTIKNQAAAFQIGKSLVKTEWGTKGHSQENGGACDR